MKATQQEKAVCKICLTKKILYVQLELLTVYAVYIAYTHYFWHYDEIILSRISDSSLGTSMWMISMRHSGQAYPL